MNEVTKLNIFIQKDGLQGSAFLLYFPLIIPIFAKNITKVK